MLEHSVKKGDIIKFFIGKKADGSPAQEHVGIVSVSEIPEYKLPDGSVLYPAKKELVAGAMFKDKWPLHWLKKFEIVGNTKNKFTRPYGKNL